MDVRRIHFLREVLAFDDEGRDDIKFEFSYDNGAGHTPFFFRVADEDLVQAHALYTAWGGSRPHGHRYGNIVRGPGSPFIQSRNPERVFHEDGKE